MYEQDYTFVKYNNKILTIKYLSSPNIFNKNKILFNVRLLVFVRYSRKKYMFKCILFFSLLVYNGFLIHSKF